MREQDGKRYVSLAEAAERLECTKVWIRTLIVTGKFSDVLRGERRSIWINEQEVEEKAASTPRAGAMKPYEREERKNVDHRLDAPRPGLGIRRDV